jgi:hypothetical protein
VDLFLYELLDEMRKINLNIFWLSLKKSFWKLFFSENFSNNTQKINSLKAEFKKSIKLLMGKKSYSPTVYNKLFSVYSKSSYMTILMGSFFLLARLLDLFLHRRHSVAEHVVLSLMSGKMRSNYVFGVPSSMVDLGELQFYVFPLPCMVANR